MNKSTQSPNSSRSPLRKKRKRIADLEDYRLNNPNFIRVIKDRNVKWVAVVSLTKYLKQGYEVMKELV